MANEAPQQGQAPAMVWGVDPRVWQASHAPTVAEHGAGRFFLSWNGALLRIAFGQNGPPTDDKGSFDPPRFQLAVSIPPALAVQLRDNLDRMIQQAQAQQSAQAAATVAPHKGNGGGGGHQE